MCHDQYMTRPGTDVPFVARQAELARLQAALERAEAGSAAAVVVSGDAGVGKSRLLAEFIAHARSRRARVLLGRCLGIGDEGLAYLPVKEIIEQAQAERDDVVATRAPLAALVRRPDGASAAPAWDADLGQLQLFDAVLGALSELADESCLVVAVEDLHWSDASTRDLLSFLLSRLHTQRLLIVATYRADDLHRRHPLRPFLAEIVRLPVVERLDLPAFGPDDAVRFVQALAGPDAPDDIVAEVAGRSEGNAFYAEELFAASSDPRAGLPTALADVLMARVESLSPAAQKVVGAVSVSGRQHVLHSALRAVADMDDDELDAGLREAVHHHILVTDADDAYTFRHALLREAVYADLLPGQRVRLHAAYAERIRAVGGDDLAAWLAYHCLHSNDLPGALAASVRAAAEAMRVGALSAELRHVEQALELWQGVDDAEARAGVDEFTLTRTAAYVAAAAGHPERALAYAQAAVSLADSQDDLLARADMRRQLTEVLTANSRDDEADRVIAEAWSLIEDTEPSTTRAWVLALRARTTPQDEQGRSFAEQAAAEARVAGAAGAEADALITLAYHDVHTGAVEQARALLEQARARAVHAEAPNTELRALFNLVVMLYEQGLIDRATQVADNAAARASELGLTWSPYGLHLRWMQVMMHYAHGSWADAIAASSPPGEPVSDTVTALLAAAGAIVKVGLGRFDEAERELAKVYPEWHRDSQIAQLAGIAGAEMAGWQGQAEAASTMVDEALASMRKSSSMDWPLGGIRVATLGIALQADLASQALSRGDTVAHAAAVAHGERLIEFAEQTHRRGVPRADKLGPEGQAWLARMHAESARLHGVDDPAAWSEVVEAFGYGEVYPIALARWRLAEALVSRGERDAATAEVVAALRIADELGARPLAAALRELARRARLSVPGVPAPTVDLLTPRERAVLELVAQGHTNRKAGEQLYISEKTVSVHISRILAKLGAGSRTEAVALAYQRGLLHDGE